jgi:hypothetical protein
MMLVRIIRAILLYYAAVHFFGCIFIHISTFEEDFNPIDTWIRRIPNRHLLPQEYLSAEDQHHYDEEA